MKNRQESGREGEERAVGFLQKKGYEILHRNVRYKRGEIDIIARDGDTVVFVEVKSRSSSGFGVPEEAVDRRKQRQLCRLALLYLQKKGWLHRVDCRFDVVAVSLDTHEIHLIKNAFPSAY